MAVFFVGFFSIDIDIDVLWQFAECNKLHSQCLRISKCRNKTKCIQNPQNIRTAVSSRSMFMFYEYHWILYTIILKQYYHKHETRLIIIKAESQSKDKRSTILANMMKENTDFIKHICPDIDRKHVYTALISFFSILPVVLDFM